MVDMVEGVDVTEPDCDWLDVGGHVLGTRGAKP